MFEFEAHADEGVLGRSQAGELTGEAGWLIERDGMLVSVNAAVSEDVLVDHLADLARGAVESTTRWLGCFAGRSGEIPLASVDDLHFFGREGDADCCVLADFRLTLRLRLRNAVNADLVVLIFTSFAQPEMLRCGLKNVTSCARS